MRLRLPDSFNDPPSCESFPIHLWFASRCNTGCDRLVAVTRTRSFQMRSDSCRGGRAPLCRAVDRPGVRPQSCQILRIECSQSCCDSWPNPNDAVFPARPKQRDPKLAPNEQSGPPHGRRATWMSLAIKVHLFHRRQSIVRDAASRRKMAIIFLHSRLERTPRWHWMCVFYVGRLTSAYGV
jgi:hypothetical protein